MLKLLPFQGVQHQQGAVDQKTKTRKKERKDQKERQVLVKEGKETGYGKEKTAGSTGL